MNVKSVACLHVQKRFTPLYCPLQAFFGVAAAMRQIQIFSGSSHPVLVESICDRLGQKPAKADLSKFSNVSTSKHISVAERLTRCRARRKSSSVRSPFSYVTPPQRALTPS